MIDHRLIEYITQALPNWVYTAGAPDAPPQVGTNCPLPGEQWQAVAEISEVAAHERFRLERAFLGWSLSEILLNCVVDSGKWGFVKPRTGRNRVPTDGR